MSDPDTQLTDDRIRELIKWAETLPGPLNIDWKVGLNCPECNAGSDRPKCFFDMGPTCPRHDPHQYSEELLANRRGPHKSGRDIATALKELLSRRLAT